MIVSIQPSQQIRRLHENGGSLLEIPNAAGAPTPLLAPLEHSRTLAARNGPEAGLYSLGFSAIPTILQYCGLLFASDYLGGTIPVEPDLSDALEEMVFRPTTGKWLTFSKMYARRLSKRGDGSLLYTFAVQYRTAQRGKEPFFVDYIENDATNDVRRSSLLDFFSILRNRLAHRRSQIAIADQLYRDAWKVVASIFSVLPELTELSLTGSGARKPYIEKSGERRTLYPVLITVASRELDDQAKSTLLLDEFDGRRVIYNSLEQTRDYGNDPNTPFHEVELLLNRVRARLPIVPADEIRIDLWNHRAASLAEKTLRAYYAGGESSSPFLAPQFDASTFVLPAEWEKILRRFEASNSSVLLLSAPQGSGKSAFLANVQSQSLSTGQSVSHILIDARQIRERQNASSALTGYLRRALRISGDITDAIVRLVMAHDLSIILLIDAVNEFYSPEETTDVVRPQQFLHGLLQFAADMHQRSGGHIKLIVSGRPEFFDDQYTQDVIRPYASQMYPELIFRNTASSSWKTTFPNLTEGECGRIYEGIRRVVPTHSPKTAWDDLPQRTRRLAENPLRMRLLMQLYCGLEITTRETEYSLRRRIAREVISDEQTRECLHHITDAMRHTPYLELTGIQSSTNSELYRLVFDSSSTNPKYNLPNNFGYQKLVARGVFREESWSDEQTNVSRLLPYNELLFQILDVDFKAQVKPYLRKINRRTYAAVTAVILAIVGFAGYRMLDRYTEVGNTSWFESLDYPYIAAYVDVWVILHRADTISMLAYFVVVLTGLLALLVTFNLTDQLEWLIRARRTFSDLASYKRVISFEENHLKQIIPLYAVYTAFYASLIGVVVALGMVKPGPLFFSGLMLGFTVPLILLTQLRKARFCDAEKRTPTARIFFFGIAERLSGCLLAAKTGFAFLFLLLIFEGSLAAIDMITARVTGPLTEARIAEAIEEQGAHGGEPSEDELVALRALATTRIENAAMEAVKGNSPPITTLLQTQLAQSFQGRQLPMMRQAIVGGGTSAVLLLLFNSLILTPLIYRILEYRARVPAE